MFKTSREAGDGVALRTLEMARAARPVMCFVCSGHCPFDADLCTHCQAPLALSYQAYAQKRLPKLFAVLGSAGAGKTVYLGLLMDLLSRRQSQKSVLLRGAFSVKAQQETMQALAACRFPPRTPRNPELWNWVHCRIQLQPRSALDVILPDMAGDALLAELERPLSYPVTHALLRECEAALLLVDHERLEEEGAEEDYFAMKALSHLSELKRDKRGRPNRRFPLAIVFTKAEGGPDVFADPAGYAAQRTPGMWRLARERFARTAFFAASVTGACAYRLDRGAQKPRVPLRIEPYGVVEPFQWLAEQMA